MQQEQKELKKGLFQVGDEKSHYMGYYYEGDTIMGGFYKPLFEQVCIESLIKRSENEIMKFVGGFTLTVRMSDSPLAYVIEPQRHTYNGKEIMLWDMGECGWTWQLINFDEPKKANVCPCCGQPTTLPEFKGWTIYDAVTESEAILDKTGYDVSDYNAGAGDLGNDVSHVYISNKGFHICRLLNGKFYALAGRSDAIDESFETIVKFIEHEMDEPAVADKRFIGAWGNKEYPNNEMRILTEDQINEDSGYDAHDIKKVQALQEGQSVTIGLSHYIMRLPDSFGGAGMVTVPLNENGTISLTNENKV